MTWLSDARETFTAGTLLLPQDEELAAAMLDALEAADELLTSLRCFVYDDPPTTGDAAYLEGVLARVRDLMEATDG